MISKKTKKILIKSAVLSILLLLSIFLYVNFANATDATIKQNDAIKQFHFPWSESVGIAGLVKQIYLIALGLVGALALGMIVFGGVQYAASAGSPSRQTDARDRITQAIWGVVLLLCAYLIFNTINPDLLKLKEPGFETISNSDDAGGGVSSNPAPLKKLSESEARALLGQFNISVDYGPCPRGSNYKQHDRCTSLEGITKNVIFELVSLQDFCPHAANNIIITGGTEFGLSTTNHAAFHERGASVDIIKNSYDLNNCMRTSPNFKPCSYSPNPFVNIFTTPTCYMSRSGGKYKLIEGFWHIDAKI